MTAFGELPPAGDSRFDDGYQRPLPAAPFSPLASSTGISRQTSRLPGSGLWGLDFPDGFDFDKTIAQIVLFELGKDALLHGKKIKQINEEREVVSRAIIQTVVRSWFWITVSRNAPHQIPEEWRGNARLFRAMVVGIRNTRLDTLVRMSRYVNGRYEVFAQHRLEREKEASGVLTSVMTAPKVLAFTAVKTAAISATKGFDSFKSTKVGGKLSHSKVVEKASFIPRKVGSKVGHTLITQLPKSGVTADDERDSSRPDVAASISGSETPPATERISSGNMVTPLPTWTSQDEAEYNESFDNNLDNDTDMV